MASDLPLCSKCGYRHAIPRFDELKLGSVDPCDREPVSLGGMLLALLDQLEAAATDGEE